MRWPINMLLTANVNPLTSVNWPLLVVLDEYSPEVSCDVVSSSGDASLVVKAENGEEHTVLNTRWRFLPEVRTNEANPQREYDAKGGMRYRICNEPGKGIGVKVRAHLTLFD